MSGADRHAGAADEVPEAYTFDGIPIDPVARGTSLMVTGPSLDGLRELLLELLVTGGQEGTLLVAADVGATAARDAFGAAGGDCSAGALRIVDCSPDEGGVSDEYVHQIASPGDLTGIGMELSDHYEGFYADGRQHVRTGIFTLAPLLVYAEDVRSVFRFVHTVAGRVRSADGLCVCALDPSAQDDRTVNSLAHVFDGKIDLRRTEERCQIRVRGLPDQPTGWQSFDPLGSSQ